MIKSSFVLFLIVRTSNALISPRRVVSKSLHQYATAKGVTEQAERSLLSILGDGRVSLSSEEESQLTVLLEALRQDEPATMSALEGEWSLLYTTKSTFDVKNPLGRRIDGTAPGVEAVFDTVFAGGDTLNLPSSSPIQRALTSIESIRIEQNIHLSSSESGRVDQLVRFVDNVSLRLSASALFNPDSGRIDFTFDLAYFDLLGFRIPYPVPFRLLGDEAKGWLDTVYVSDCLRISSGNKGTTLFLNADNYTSKRYTVS